MMHRPYSASSNGGPVAYLPTYHHRPLEVGYHEIPLQSSEARIVVCAGPDSHFLAITVGQQKSR